MQLREEIHRGIEQLMLRSGIPYRTVSEPHNHNSPIHSIPDMDYRPGKAAQPRIHACRNWTSTCSWWAASRSPGTLSSNAPPCMSKLPPAPCFAADAAHKLGHSREKNRNGAPALIPTATVYCAAAGGSDTKELPASITQLLGLQHPELRACRMLKALPASIGQLKGFSAMTIEFNSRHGGPARKLHRSANNSARRPRCQAL